MHVELLPTTPPRKLTLKRERLMEASVNLAGLLRGCVAFASKAGMVKRQLMAAMGQSLGLARKLWPQGFIDWP
jgi:hypothetical protein